MYVLRISWKCAGGSIPVTLTFQEATKKNVLHLPMGSSDDGAHSQNEKIDERNFVEGRKVLGAYLYELGKLWNQENYSGSRLYRLQYIT